MKKIGPLKSSLLAVVFGAGSVGRGFLGQLLSESGYEVVFVDIDKRLVQALSDRGSYQLRLAGIIEETELTVQPVRALDGRDTDRVADAVASASMVATAVGARVLPAIAEPLAAGLARRWEAGCTTSTNVIICENLRDAPDLLRGYVHEALPPRLGSMVEERVGFVPAVIARMSPVPSAEQRRRDPSLIVAEPYKVLPVDRTAFVGEIPGIVGMEPVSPFAAYVARKLYVHNAAHAILGYLGYRRGYAAGFEALEDPQVRSVLESALDEVRTAMIARYNFEPVSFKEHVDYLMLRFANRRLADPIHRLARDPLRKLAPDDRLVGTARLVEEHGVRPEGLAWGIAAALAYDDAEDEHAADLQARLARESLGTTLERVCGIQPSEELAVLVRSRYRQLLEDPRWQRERSGSPSS